VAQNEENSLTASRFPQLLADLLYIAKLTILKKFF
jgi:hypothetical protein